MPNRTKRTKPVNDKIYYFEPFVKSAEFNLKAGGCYAAMNLFDIVTFFYFIDNDRYIIMVVLYISAEFSGIILHLNFSPCFGLYAKS